MARLIQYLGFAGIADIIGRRFGFQKLPYNQQKSWAGSCSMFIFGFLISIGWTKSVPPAHSRVLWTLAYPKLTRTFTLNVQNALLLFSSWVLSTGLDGDSAEGSVNLFSGDSSGIPPSYSGDRWQHLRSSRKHARSIFHIWLLMVQAPIFLSKRWSMKSCSAYHLD